MNFSATQILGLFITYIFVISVAYCTDIKTSGLTKEEIISLTRDHFGRRNPDAVLDGFFPVWAVIQFGLSGCFLVIALISGICYLLGCRSPQEERAKSVK